MANHAITISIKQCRFLAFQPAGAAMQDVEGFLDTAAQFKISTTICTDTLLDMTVLESLVGTLGSPKPNHPREVIMVCGAYLEEQISLAAQYLLIVGYPIFLVRDMIVAKNSELSHIHDRRLSLAGAVATTSQQLIYEWAASEKDLIRKALLNDLLS